MSYHLSWKPYQLRFRFDARTSRGAMTTHNVYFLQLSDTEKPGKIGWGECAPLPGLSPDFDNITETLTTVSEDFNRQLFREEGQVDEFIKTISQSKFPSVRFALESVALDHKNGAHRLLFASDFTGSGKGIPINGLIWMGKKDWMKEQIKEKVSTGFTTIKLKIGALNFEEELDLLKWIRSEYSQHDLTLRVDANGAFSKEEALDKLRHLESVQLHSIEQPIMAGQWEEMAMLCEKSPVPIALDEELIGNQEVNYKQDLVTSIRPQFIILKPTLHGGLLSCSDWIREADGLGIGWWITSALESNIGLNVISQFAATFHSGIPQGLGTGQLYENNIPSALDIVNGEIFYNSTKNWNLDI